MPDLEKVIRGLEICSAGDVNYTKRNCTACSYYPAGYTGCTAKRLMRDALELLKAQEPRVMTLEEVFEKSKHIDDCFVFVEYYSDDLERDDKPDLEPCFIHNEKSYFEKDYHIVSVFRGGACMCFLQSYYGETWRCWTSRPTDEQREAVECLKLPQE